METQTGDSCQGTVDSQHEKEYAQLLAHIEGILGVNNRLQIRRR